MKRLIFTLGLMVASYAKAVPANSFFAANEIGLCGFSLSGLFTSKAFYRYQILPNSDLVSGLPSPAQCVLAVSRLEGVAARTPEEDTLLAAAATGWLATTLKLYLDRDGSGDVDATIDVENRNSLSDEQAVALFTAQNAFLKYVPLFVERGDFLTIAKKIHAACNQVSACDLDPEDHSPRAIALMRNLFAEILKQ